MDQPSPPDSKAPNSTAVIESQIRECYGRVVYSHKTHEKYADILDKRLRRIKFWQIFLSALITGGLIVTIFDKTKASTIATGLISTGLLVLNAYTKNYNLGELVQMHKDAAVKLWSVRESYLSLLSDLKIGDVDLAQIRDRRDQLQNDLATVYKTAPRTNYKAYSAAQKALQECEDMTFSDDEIDKFLPGPFKRSQ